MTNAPPIVPNSLNRVEIVTYPGAQLLDICGPLQVFATVNEFACREGRPEQYQCLIVSRQSHVMTTAGLGLEANLLPDADSELDTLIVVGGLGVAEACQDAELVAWIERRSRKARRVASVCTGAFLLAQAHLLDGKAAVTHWKFCAEFKERFPTIKVDADRLFVRDDKVWTSAGVTAGIDLCLALVEEDFGRKLALSVAQYLVMFLKRPGGQSQFSTTLSLQGEAEFDRLHIWINENLDKELSLIDLADLMGMSSRTLSRRYKAASGRTPARAVEELRVEAARRLLEQGRSPSLSFVKCGFASKETMRRAFLRTIGVGPQEYADRFGPSKPKPRSLA
ncbi:GlxA family transcriptional regulator [Mesorhizobium sp. CO1-1-8]|uniref:GlxA family transcriptional regulator n=1 Tax=Mesorhizobium sp. CO1-1-8 TaxID=2876631 RepID=UPI001CD05459|nr:GlxA family transcriptional regulator [Mesorhizobium sp. CO1-1-8]MBZ9772463.1 GlxA family transcriptional regulator [Mesorhizobium sp. CO1-1-8]